MNIEIILYLWAIVGTAAFIDAVRKRTMRQSVKSQRVASVFGIVGITLFIYYVSQIIGSAFAYAVPALRGWSVTQALDWFQTSPIGQFTLILFVDVWTIILLLAVLKLQKQNFKDIGFFGKPRLVDGGYILAGFAIYFAVYTVISAAAARLISGFDLEQKQEIGFGAVSGVGLVAAFLSLVILPPLIEELLTRGFLFSSLRKHISFMASALITSILFGIAHLQPGLDRPLLWVAALDTFILSMVLVWIREKRGTLWACIGLHMLKNSIAFLAIFIFKIV